MKLLIDTNLSPRWTSLLAVAGWKAMHWSEVGDPRAPGAVIFTWARSNGYTVLTQDLDFGTLLAHTHAAGPSAVQLRTRDILPDHLGDVVVRALRDYANAIDAGALVTVDEFSARIRILPIAGRRC